MHGLSKKFENSYDGLWPHLGIMANIVSQLCSFFSACLIYGSIGKSEHHYLFFQPLFFIALADSGEHERMWHIYATGNVFHDKAAKYFCRIFYCPQSPFVSVKDSNRVDHGTTSDNLRVVIYLLGVVWAGDLTSFFCYGQPGLK